MRTCSIPGCGKKHKARGLCEAHDRRNRQYGDPHAGPPPPKKSPAVCTADGCDGTPVAHGLCGKHYYRFQKYGDPTKAKFEWSDKRRDWHVGHLGYVVRYAPESPHSTSNGYEYQHRVVMGQMLGRRLLPNETPHHINGDRTDNRPENLELWVKSQPAGQRVQDLVSWAREILLLYDKEPFP